MPAQDEIVVTLFTKDDTLLL